MSAADFSARIAGRYRRAPGNRRGPEAVLRQDAVPVTAVHHHRITTVDARRSTVLTPRIAIQLSLPKRPAAPTRADAPPTREVATTHHRVTVVETGRVLVRTAPPLPTRALISATTPTVTPPPRHGAPSPATSPQTPPPARAASVVVIRPTERAVPSVRPPSMVVHRPTPSVASSPAVAPATTPPPRPAEARWPSRDAAPPSAAVAVDESQLNRLTDRVVQQINRRVLAQRERLGGR